MGAPKDPEKRKQWIERIKKNHADQTGKNNPMYGRDRSGKKNGMYGKKQTQEAKDKITGENSGMWKGKEYQGKDGRWYIYVKANTRRIRRSRYVAMICLGRELTQVEVVHHMNEDCSDDRPENLYLFPNLSEHMKQHHMKNPPLLISNLIK